MQAQTSLAQWLETEPFHLSMSSGFFSFFAHLGFISVLEQRGLRPKSISGSSAGALIGSLWASGLNSQALAEEVFKLKKSDFWDPGLGLGLLKGEKFRHKIRQLSPISRIEDCPIPLSLSVYNTSNKSTEVRRQGELADVLYASCAVPILFQPIKIDGQRFADGGIKDRSALAGVQSGERVFYHHIASRSPWRKKNDPALQVPQRDNQVSLSLQNLQRSGPNKLDLGPQIFKQAQQLTERALAMEAAQVIELG